MAVHNHKYDYGNAKYALNVYKLCAWKTDEEGYQFQLLFILRLFTQHFQPFTQSNHLPSPIICTNVINCEFKRNCKLFLWKRTSEREREIYRLEKKANDFVFESIFLKKRSVSEKLTKNDALANVNTVANYFFSIAFCVVIMITCYFEPYTKLYCLHSHWLSFFTILLRLLLVLVLPCAIVVVVVFVVPNYEYIVVS